MSARRHGQGGQVGHFPRIYCKVFCALAVTVSGPIVYALFSQKGRQIFPGTLPMNLPTTVKNPAGAHDSMINLF